jgi:hypothetical protein
MRETSNFKSLLIDDLWCNVTRGDTFGDDWRFWLTWHMLHIVLDVFDDIDFLLLGGSSKIHCDLSASNRAVVKRFTL